MRRLGYGPHTVTARAYDGAGQLDADAVAVRRVHSSTLGEGRSEVQRQGSEERQEQPALAGLPGGREGTWRRGSSFARGAAAPTAIVRISGGSADSQVPEQGLAALKGLSCGRRWEHSQAT